MVVDYKDAFMSTGTRADEQRFTAARVNDPDSPTGVYIYVWKTLGFGGSAAIPPPLAFTSVMPIQRCSNYEIEEKEENFQDSRFLTTLPRTVTPLLESV